MKSVLQFVATLALIAVTVMAGEVAYTVHRLRPHLEVTLENVDRTVVVAGVAATHLEKASDVWLKASQDQTKEFSKAMSNVNAVAGQATGLLSNLDTRLNSELLPGISATLTTQDRLLTSNQEKLGKELDALNLATTNLNLSLVNVSKITASPEIPTSLENLDRSTRNLSAATKDAADSMVEVRKGITYEVDQLMAPVSKVKKVTLFLLQAAGRFLGY